MKALYIITILVLIHPLVEINKLFITNKNHNKMPIAAAPIIAAGISAAGQAGTAYAQGKTNLKTRQFAEEMYFRQRADALSDWDRQNQYNSPAEQMKRFQEAGLNPHLIYGQSNTADAVRSAPVQSWNPKAPEFDGRAVSAAYFNTQMQQAQQDMVQKQMQVMNEDIELKRAQAIFTRAQAETSTFDLALKNTLRDTNLQVAETSLNQQKQNLARGAQTMQIEMERNIREASRNTADIYGILQNAAKSLDDMATNAVQRDAIRQSIENAKKDGTLKDFEINLAKQGVTKNDPLWARELARFVNWLIGENKGKDPLPNPQGGLPGRDTILPKGAKTPVVRYRDYLDNQRY